MKTIQYFANGNLGKNKQRSYSCTFQHTYQWHGIRLQKLEILYNDLGCSILSVCACACVPLCVYVCVCMHACTYACVSERKRERCINLCNIWPNYSLHSLFVHSGSPPLVLLRPLLSFYAYSALSLIIHSMIMILQRTSAY